MTDPEVSLKNKVIKEFTTSYGTKEDLEIRKIQMNIKNKDSRNKVQQLSFGFPCPQRQTKVIMLIGATGTGKTTLINAMVNFIFRIKFEDNYRLTLIDDENATKKSQAESQTEFITAYVFNYMDGMPFEYNYILVDTPGFGDTRGIQKDREMMGQLESFLKNNYATDAIDVVGFVTPASAARLTHTQRYVFDGLSAMFGKNVKDNIHILTTFADAKLPAVITALKEAGINYTNYYKFNNSALCAANKVPNSTETYNPEFEEDEDEDDVLSMTKLFWDMCVRSMNNFFIKLGKTSPVSLTLTREVLEERRKLQTIVVGLQNNIQVGLSMLSNLHQERSMLNRMNVDINGSQNYEEEVDVPKIKKVDLDRGVFVTNCSKCNYTCHYPCSRFHDQDKKGCAAMKKGLCVVCPKKCDWFVHHNMNFRFVTNWIKEKRTIKEILNRYNDAIEGKHNIEITIQKIEREIELFGKHLLSTIKEAQNHVEKLEQIALKPNPISTKEYIDLLIESEKLQKFYNFRKRIEMLEILKNEVGVLSAVTGSASAFQDGGEQLLQHFQALMK